MLNQAAVANNIFSSPSQTSTKNGLNTSQGPVNAPNRKMEEDEDDVDSLNINFDDVNEQSDLEEYYNSSPEQVISTNSNSNEIAQAGSRTETCLYEGPQQFAFNPKVIGHQITPCNKPNIGPRVNSNLFMNSPVSSPTNPVLDNVMGSEFNSIDASYGIPANSKPNTKNIHCIKEKIRR